MISALKKRWGNFSDSHPSLAQFLMFFIVSNGVTALQLLMMPAFKSVFGMTDLVNTNFQVWHIGSNLNGVPYYVFNYPSGTLASGGGGGYAYFLAVEISIGIAQVINFFLQRNVTFKANNNYWKAAFWYILAYIIISIGASALQGLYKTPIYDLFINIWSMGSLGETIADAITMIINSAISFWVFFPIFKFIFSEKKEKTITCE